MTSEPATIHEHPGNGGRLILLAGFPGALGVGLQEVIGRDDEFDPVRDESHEGIAATIERRRPEVALINCDALANLVELRKLALGHPDVGIVVAVPRTSRQRDDDLLAAGARAVVPITVEAYELTALLRFVARGLVGPPRPASGPRVGGLGQLTPREAQVLELLVRRQSAIEIAEALYVSVATVNSHRRRIYEKLGVHSRRELAMRAAEAFGLDAGERETPFARSRERLACTSRTPAAREHDRAVVIDMCTALGAQRWLGRSA